jgi:hypothetical protein
MDREQACNLRVAAPDHSPWTAIVLGGVVAGTLDIGAAALINWASPALILRFVAGGLLGKTALDGGAAIALLGYGVQIAMSLIIAAIYVGAGRRLGVVARALDRGGARLRRRRVLGDELRRNAVIGVGALAAFHRHELRVEHAGDAGVRRHHRVLRARHDRD